MTSILGHATLNSGLLAHWAMDGNANDSKGVHNGVVTGSVSYEDGKLNQAAQFLNTVFNSVDWITVAAHADFTLSKVGVAYWFKILSLAQTGHPIFKGASFAASEWFCRFLSSNKYIAFGIRDTIGNVYEVTTGLNSIVDNEWHHLAACYDGAQLKIWLDAVAKTPVDHAGLIGGALSDLIIGSRGGPTKSEGLNGQIDEMMVHDREYTQAEVDFLASDPPPPYEEEEEPEPPEPPDPGGAYEAGRRPDGSYEWQRTAKGRRSGPTQAAGVVMDERKKSLKG